MTSSALFERKHGQKRRSAQEHRQRKPRKLHSVTRCRIVRADGEVRDLCLGAVGPQADIADAVHDVCIQLAGHEARNGIALRVLDDDAQEVLALLLLDDQPEGLIGQRLLGLFRTVCRLGAVTV